MLLPRLAHDPRELRGAASAPIEWVPELDCWCAFETDTISAILKSRDFAAADFAQWHDALSKIGIDCSALVGVLNYVAIANEGERHGEIREAMARCIAAQSGDTKQAVADKIATLVPKALREGRRVDLVREVIQPVCDTLFERLLGVTVPFDEGISASQIFDLYLSLNRRKQIVSSVAALSETYEKAEDHLTIASGYATSLRMLGYDSIVGSLGGSILCVLEEAGGQRFCDIDYPAKLPITGVPYIERFAAVDCQVGESAIKEGDRVRLYLERNCRGDRGASSENYFGWGRHSCLGENLSMSLWRTLTAELAKLTLRAEIVSAERRRPDWVFTYYSSIVADIHV